ncbi:hypothetical protein ANCCEY_03258 [Ancylostoma ceylanicum]|uniref:DNA repair and recombination protein RAD54-like n=1 Tax=Ancylostoma ceylanicum TaxID=53326 RepID=A0A0D6MBE5_9BILA|nr:hypothetical protein ANCCEY_03258 [Ancylostoma ceylanicum]
MDPNCDAPGVSDAERTEDHDDINSVKLPRGSATSHDELDIVGVSTHDIDDLEKDRRIAAGFRDECKQVPSLGRRQKTSKPKTTVSTYVDDSNDNDFKERLSTTFSSDVGDNTDYKELTDSLRISRQVWDRLYKYQKKGVVWLSGLHEQYVGGILADEMGLGKTVQVIAFLRALDESQKQDNYMKSWSMLNHLSVDPPETVDEGHKIRNPKAQVSQTVKQLHTPCRLILSGTPLQNSLTEIWSLIDFVYCGKLNSLETFTERFAIPITQGGYANATKQQLVTAYKCAVVLRDAISPYILRRLKKDVKRSLDLPDKNEKVLFCELSPEQRRLYLDYLNSRECRNIFRGRLDPFVGLTLLRKLCNHPDLVTGGPNRHGEFDESEDPSKSFGFPDRSGKMRVLMQLLTIWKKQGGEKALVFSQSREMLDVLEKKFQNDGFTYLRMDGSTNIGSRQKRVQQFNEDPDIFIFLLTTRVGGLGINLTAANKVVIFDPDWNPSTDTQAKERSWRIGQERSVTVYRLLCAGTIEEKQFLANRILKDPKQRQFFKTNDLHDLFSLSDVNKDAPTETGTLFASETSEIRKGNFFDGQDREKRKKTKRNREEIEESVCDEAPLALSEEKKAELRERAKQLARNLLLTTSNEGREAASNSVKQDTEKKLDESMAKKRLYGSLGPEASTSKTDSLAKSKKTNIGKRSSEEKSENGANDDFVLSCLLKSAGVRCAIQHDDLVDDKPSDYLIEKEAAAVANNAAKALGKRSNRSFIRKFLAVPSSRAVLSASTRTTEQAPFNGKKVSDTLFAAIHARKRKANDRRDSEVVVKDKYVAMAEKIRDFLVNCGGRAYTEMIFDTFKTSEQPHSAKNNSSFYQNFLVDRKILSFEDR